MTEKQDRLMTRKKFIKISSAGLLGVGLLGKSTALLGKSLKNQVERILNAACSVELELK